jgi:hypothetical protein
MPCVWLIGYYQRGNYGDNLLQEAAQYLLRRHALRFLNDIDMVAVASGACALNLLEPDYVVLFGGEVLTQYFLDRLVRLVRRMQVVRKEAQKPMPQIQAVGVSSNVPYLELAPYLNLFDLVLPRNALDVDFFASREERSLDIQTWESRNSGSQVSTRGLSAVDPVFLLPGLARRGRLPTELNRKTLIALPCASDETELEKQAWRTLLTQCVQAGFRVLLGAFSIDPAQDDRASVQELLTQLPTEISQHMQAAPSASELSFSRCAGVISARFHGVILAISQAKPFVAMRGSCKVRALIRDSGLDLRLHLWDPTDAANFTEQAQEKTNLFRNLTGPPEADRRCVARKCKQIAQDNYWKWQRSLSQPFLRPPRPVHVALPWNELVPALWKAAARLREVSVNNHELAQILLMELTGNPTSCFAWGLAEKIAQITGQEEGLRLTEGLLESLEPDLKYLAEREMLRGSQELDCHLHLLGLVSWSYSFPPGAFNTFFQHQRDAAGLHRVGWDSVIQSIENAGLCTVHPDAPWLDMYVDRTFHWCRETMELSGTIPYQRPWAGFIHHTCFSDGIPNNAAALLSLPVFLASLPQCRALCVLSRALQHDLQGRLQALGIGVPVLTCYHPMPAVPLSKRFSPAAFGAAPSIVQVGAWYRDLEAIYRLRARLTPQIKCQALCGPLMQGLYNELLGELQADEDPGTVSRPISRPISTAEHLDPQRASEIISEVELLQALSNDRYDQLLRSHILFIYLRDASAVNTVLEAIRYHTPILVNPLPAVVEYLGEAYPLYFRDLDEAAAKASNFDLVSEAHFYLANLDASFLDPQRFVEFIRWLGQGFQLESRRL